VCISYLFFSIHNYPIIIFMIKKLKRINIVFSFKDDYYSSTDIFSVIIYIIFFFINYNNL